MPANSIMPLFPSQDLPATQAFYAEYGFEAVFSGPAYLQLSYQDKPDIRIAFFKPVPDHPLGMYRVTDAGAAFLSVEVEDVDACLASAKQAGHTLVIAPRSEPWGQRHFALADPNGIIVDFNKMELLPNQAAA
ncbi:MAG: VOC family protein [Pseudomonadota bacterium]